MEVLCFFFLGGGVWVGQPKSQLCFAKGRELKGLLGAMAEQLQPRRNFAGVEEGKKGSTGLEKATSSCPAWEPWGPWAPTQRRRASSQPSHDNPDEPHPFACLPKASPPSTNTQRWLLLEVLRFTGVTAWSRRGYGCWRLQILPGEWVPVRSTGCHAGTGHPLAELGCSAPARMLSPAHSSRGIQTYFHPGLQIQQ